MSFVVVCNTARQRICNVTHQGAARDGGSVVLCPVRATPCFTMYTSVSDKLVDIEKSKRKGGIDIGSWQLAWNRIITFEINQNSAYDVTTLAVSHLSFISVTI